jgi:hypothetical protein
MFHSLLRSVLVLSLVCVARAGAGGGGNTSYRAEVEPLVKARKELAKPLYGLELADVGEGASVSYLRSPFLAGRHVGPYDFTATDAAGRKVKVTFHTRSRYRNDSGVVVADVLDGELIAGGTFSSATKLSEELVGVSVSGAR